MTPVLVLTQGDPAGIGPEILLKALAADRDRQFIPLLVAEGAGLEAIRGQLPKAPWDRLVYLQTLGDRSELPTDGSIAVLDPVGSQRRVTPGQPTEDDALGSMAALDRGVQLVRGGIGDALVTAPLSKEVIARHLDSTFRGHTDHLAAEAGLEQYGRDYLMAFRSKDLNVALLSTHLPLRSALDAVSTSSIIEALQCLAVNVGPEAHIGVAGLNPHAGENGLMGFEDDLLVRPAVEAARELGINASGPESPDSIFVRARQGAYDWVLALYHDQGLIALKTAAFGEATHQTLGLPYIRTSVDHGTAYGIAGQGQADAGSLRAVIATTLRLIADR